MYVYHYCTVDTVHVTMLYLLYLCCTYFVCECVMVEQLNTWLNNMLQWLNNMSQWLNDMSQWLNDMLQWLNDMSQWLNNMSQWLNG